ncbi:abscisic acid receptor PYL4 [Brachypodium distachyon]|uniref:Uncharacterized protein n=1 Tax=Brachypodium distachyon TaxID=15368 RepID=I1GQW2_BRADI|nr:abscisic acid receptor PYL4 [Brachypodium distachyon]KQK14503.1 hypothetical protein BRADI_1g16710v3 [Brachypodium distachyon]|eukprot:XP_003559749.1 abscisic acid receptor PYL4 [Brachypodium distachyon]
MPAPYSAAAAQQLQQHRPLAAAVTGSRCGEHDGTVPAEVAQHHSHPPSSSAGPWRCCSAVVQRVRAPTSAVWSVVRRFGEPQAYKSFVRSCAVVDGDGGVGTLREVRVVSGLPAASSRERLEVLDDDRRVLSFRVVGGEHRLRNYRSVTTVHPSSSSSSPAEEETVVVESYVVEVPAGNTAEDTRTFVDTIVKCNLLSLARTAEKLSAAGRCP